MNDTKLIVFDINDTLITTHSWENFNVALGMTAQEDLVLWELNQQGILSNKHWVEIVNNLYQKRGTPTKKLISDTLLEYEFIEYAKELVTNLKKKYEVALISGAPDILVEHIAKELDIDMFGSNALLRFDTEDILEEMVVLSDEPQSKVIYLQAFCRRLGIDETQVVAVGDGANDVELFKRTKHGITFENSKIRQHAWKVVKSLKDIETLL